MQSDDKGLLVGYLEIYPSLRLLLRGIHAPLQLMIPSLCRRVHSGLLRVSCVGVRTMRSEALPQ